MSDNKNDVKDFKFEVYEEVPKDDHIEFRLVEKEHKPEQDVISEKQLDDYRFNVEEVITEKLLDQKRLNKEPVIIEKALNDAPTKFGTKHRNEEAYTGDINKLEEKRISSHKNEDEKYEPASEYPKKMRWWEEKIEDDLKVANSDSKKKLVTAQFISDVEDEVEDEDEENEEYEEYEEYEIDPFEDIDLEPYIDNVVITDKQENKEEIPTVSIKFEYDPEFFDNNVDLAKRAAYDKLVNKNHDLADIISPDDITETKNDGELFVSIYGDTETKTEKE